jgi:ribosome-binding factor A
MKLKDLNKYLAPKQDRVIKGKRQAKEIERFAHQWIATLRDESLQDVNITGVNLSADLKLVTLLYLGKAKFTHVACNNFKHYLSVNIKLRRMPEIRFIKDKDYESILRTEDIFNRHDDS